MATDSGMPARLAASTTLSGPTRIPSGTKTVFIEWAIAFNIDVCPQPSFP